MGKSKRLIIEKIPFIDVRDLSKSGAFDGGERSFPYVSFRYPFLYRMRTYKHRADLWQRRGTAWASFPIEWTRCNYGGWRPWFRCALCGRRVAKIYGGGIFLGCRHCCDAHYECQRYDAKSRAYYQACKLRLSLGGEPSMRGPFPERPRRMWRRTYERLRREADALEAPLLKSRYAKRPPDYERFSFF